MYFRANAIEPAYLSVIFAQIALENLSWNILVERERIKKRKDFNGMSAPKRIRELLSWMGVSPDIPPELTDLRRVAPKEDGPQAIVQIRNDVVHAPIKRRCSTDVEHVYAISQAAELSLYYVELALLRCMNYRGPYHNRMTGFAFVSENSPPTPSPRGADYFSPPMAPWAVDDRGS